MTSCGEPSEVFLLRVVGLRSLGSYRKAGVTARLAVGFSVLALLILAVALTSLSLGPVNIPAGRVAAIALAFFGFDVGGFGRTEQLVIEQIRLPRIIVGASVGAALGVAGATLQGLFRNPMADPGIIGVSAGGALGAVVAIAMGLDRPLLPRPAGLRVRGRAGRIPAGLRHRRRGRAILHGHAPPRRRRRQRLPQRRHLRHHHHPARQRSPPRHPLLARGRPGLPLLGARPDRRAADRRRRGRHAAHGPRPQPDDARRRRGALHGRPRRPGAHHPARRRGPWPPAPPSRSAASSPSWALSCPTSSGSCSGPTTACSSP